MFCFISSFNVEPAALVRLYSSSANNDNHNSTTNENLTLAGEPVSPMHGSSHWSFERVVSVATLGLVGAAALQPHSMVDFALGFIVPVHCHIGFGAIITDYLPNRKFPVIYKFARGVLYATTALTIYGLYKYNTEDVGITEGVKALWQAKKVKKSDEQ